MVALSKIDVTCFHGFKDFVVKKRWVYLLLEPRQMGGFTTIGRDFN
jgi:hypothetical protein